MKEGSFMRCSSCGNMLQENACICDKCGAFCGIASSVPSKKEYFKSGSQSKKSKILTIIGWVLINVMAFCLAFNVAMAIFVFSSLDEDISKCTDAESVVKVLAELGGTDVETFEEELKAIEKDDPDDLIRRARTMVWVSAGIVIAVPLASLTLSIFAVWKKSFKCAIWALVLSIFLPLSYIATACTIAISMFAYIWSNEYKAYCMNPNANINQNFDFS